MTQQPTPDTQGTRLYLILAVLGVILACVAWFEFVR